MKVLEHASKKRCDLQHISCGHGRFSGGPWVKYLDGLKEKKISMITDFKTLLTNSVERHNRGYGKKRQQSFLGSHVSIPGPQRGKTWGVVCRTTLTVCMQMLILFNLCHKMLIFDWQTHIYISAEEQERQAQVKPQHNNIYGHRCLHRLSCIMAVRDE